MRANKKSRLKVGVSRRDFMKKSATVATVAGIAGMKSVEAGPLADRANAPKGILRHTVAFNFKPDVSQELIEKILAETRKTLPTIKGATNIVVGRQTSDWTKYKYGISIDFVNKEAKEFYAKSPQSLKLHQQYKQYVEEEVVIDVFNE